MSYSDDIHRLLGYALARELCNGTMIREGDRLGIGPGRGVYETVRAMQRQKSIRARSVTLVSLSGVGYLRHHSNNRNLLLDSDFIISFMGEAFDFPVTLDVVAAPLVAPAFESASIFNSWLTLPDRTRPTLNTAILGVGSFAGGNRFFEEASASVATQQPAYEAIRPALRALRVATSKLPVGEYVPVADVGYHLFFAPSPQRKSSLPESVEADIQRQLEAINRLLLSAHKNHFKSMQSVMLVAGTRGKASALHHLLSSSWIRVTHVTTDRATAHALLTF